MKLRIGTRKSRLAMVQTEIARNRILELFPDMEVEIVPIVTKGDQILDRSLTSFGGKGVFTKELEEELLQGSIDLAVHSAKDMPMEFPEGLALGAVLERAEAADVLVTTSGIPAEKLGAGSVIGTSSLRRELQIRDWNPQVCVKLLRGNVQTRIRRLLDGDYDAILLAAAGLERLGLVDGAEAILRDGRKLLKVEYDVPVGCGKQELYLEYLDKARFIPAAGQGILTIENRAGEFGELMAALHSESAAIQLKAEREYLTILGGGCNAPCGAYCREEKDTLIMDVMYAQDGAHPRYRNGFASLRGTQAERMEQAERLARYLAEQVCLKTVSLVGAGPGDAGLFTRKGLDCVRKADVIVYDNLISGSILNEARLDAELIYAGKRSSHHHMTQEQINTCLVEHALRGKYVVRLKGGDPYIFGRGGEEALELDKHGIPFEIVPGVSSSYSVPAYAGIPVTHRELASSFHVITGHESGTKDESVLDYATLAKEEGTLVFLMGLRNLEKIVSSLIACGKAKDTPAAVIQQGTTARQKRAVADLEHIVGEVKRCGIQTPAITVVGAVAGLAERLEWFGDRKRWPLAGKRVLVTGTRYIAGEMEKTLKPLGAEVITVSLIESRPLRSAETDQILAHLDQYRWMVFTSSNGVDLFFEIMREQNLDLRSLMHVKFAAIGRKTAAALKEHGFSCDFVPENFSGADLAKEWIPMLGKEERVLLLRAKEGSPVLPQKLKEAGILFDDVPLYETWVDTRRAEELNRVIRDADYVTAASASAVKALHGMLEEKVLSPAKLVSIGPSTTKAAKMLGLSVNVEASEYTAEGMAAAILADTRKNEEARESEAEHIAESDTGHLRFPLFFDLTGKRILIVGAGTIAARRAESLADFGAELLVVAPKGAEQMKKLEQERGLRWIRRAYEETDLDGMDLVLAATDDPVLNAAVVRACKARKIPVNHAGDKAQSDFYFPGIARNGSLVVGVTASGDNHRLARQAAEELRQWIRQRKE
ncbi:MAG: uroporphyrinogen-III C-methyltransferase [Lachnospiraceae bacterium]|nr:uroporphyrinogen-III C-methyltransferase [Lachnospiraceae bacterium]